MYVIEKMKLNKLEKRPIVSNRSLFAVKGDSSATISSKADSSCFSEPSVDGASKTKILGLVDEMYKSATAKKASDGKSPDMQNIDAKNK